MTRRRDIERQRHGLSEIRGIMNSMKTLAFMETRKLSGFLNAQQTAIVHIETVAADFLYFHPHLIPHSAEERVAFIIVGSERGFCGDFNRRLELSLVELLRKYSGENRELIVLGRKLHPLIRQIDPSAELLPGAGVLEEIPTQLDALSASLSRLYQAQGPDTLFCLFHDRSGEIRLSTLLPPFQQLKRTCDHGAIPPLLNQPPAEFLAGLSEHYLFAFLHWILYSSLMAENHQRVTHLEGALRHLDNQSKRLAHLSNVLRQEEIIEEIEVILLSVG
ncbi:MAG: F0F1 ATP synthase subunit gamma [Candidatus Thiodiazotropha sp.]